MILVEKMPGYGYLTLAVWPEPWYEGRRWMMYEFKVRPDGTLHWYSANISTDEGHARAEVYADFKEAVAIAEARNVELLRKLAESDLGQNLKRSYELKATKAIQIKSRLAHEEELMLAEAKKRGSQFSNSTPASIEGGVYPDYIADLQLQLQEMPYLKIVNVKGHLLVKKENNNWSRPRRLTKKGYLVAARAKIANGFGFQGTEHWGKTKAAIREILLPRANQLLQLASVQRLLAEAKMRGEYVLVAGGYVFWYDSTDEIGWSVKQTESKADSAGITLWREGTIISKNHGRIVILPYIKENGDGVKGHTRNAPHDGPAKPRHPDNYVELPFKVLKDDLMIGLFGELPYE